MARDRGAWTGMTVLGLSVLGLIGLGIAVGKWVL